MPPTALRMSAAQRYLTLASLIVLADPKLAERLIESAARVLSGRNPVWDEAEELQRSYISGV